jgi:uncharacterized protein YaaQ
MMKMIIAIIQDEDEEPVSEALGDKGLTVTRIASTGGFLRQGRSTLMIGVDSDQVDQVIQVINKNCGSKFEPILKRAAIFVLNVEHYEQL